MDPSAPRPPLTTATIPRATYRLQLHAGFRLVEAEAIVPYLAALGVSHLYTSPLLKARPGSVHGYDVIDPGVLNPELGTEADLSRLSTTLAAHGMQLLLDIVPNHMGVIEADNPWWLDVLENGPAAAHAKFFDIDWSPPQPELHGKLLLPVLGGPYGEVLESGEITAAFDARRGRFELRYHAHRFPIDPSDHPLLLRQRPLPTQATAADVATLTRWQAAFEQLPARDAGLPKDRQRRQRALPALQRALADFGASAAWALHWLQDCAAALHGRPGEPTSFDLLDGLLQSQAYRLVHWRAAADDINYRRFFDVDALAALRVEDPEVFEASHARVLDWVARSWVAGLRIDHPDGMSDPAAYFERLQRRCAEVRAGDGPSATYVVIEKILAEGEPWPRDWPVHGETGYRFSNQVHGLFVDGRRAAAFDALTTQFVGSPVDYAAELDEAKRGVMQRSLASDLRLLTELAHQVARARRPTRDFTRESLKAAIVEFVAAFDVYRSYVGDAGAGPPDRACIERAAATARGRCRASLAGYIDFLRALMLAPPGEAGEAGEATRLRFVRRLQQFTAPVMAKGMEDTAFYRFHRLPSLNDVGGDPLRFGMTVAEFHAANLARLQDMPHTLLASSTHDSKRSADVRARLAVLSEMPAQWLQTLQRWRELARAQWRIGGLQCTPAPNDELLLYQTLVGIWPAGAVDEATLSSLRERVEGFMLKALREAKQRSSWLDRDPAYEQDMQRCIALLLARLEPNPFLSELRRFVDQIAPFGCCNSLGLVAIKLTAPGVPDLYQGCEDWVESLVDPDNRRPVDFAALRRKGTVLGARLAAGKEALLRSALPGGLHKLLVTTRLLQWRREAEALFRDGAYLPLPVEGPRADHLLAFARIGEADCSITLATRLPWQLGAGDIDLLRGGDCWASTQVLLPIELQATAWHEVLTDEPIGSAPGAAGIDVATALRHLPVALLRPAR